jgi:SAM-dependent methyltransferase
VVGIDPSAIAVATARRIDPTSIVDWQQWDDGRLPFDDGSFDVVACQHALHRFPDPDLILEEMRRLLPPGGRLGITTWGPIEENPAFAAQLDAVVKAGLDESGVVDALLDAFAWHRPEDLEMLARRAGLVDISCQTIRTRTSASSSWPGPPNSCDLSSTTVSFASRRRHGSSWPVGRVTD